MRRIVSISLTGCRSRSQPSDAPAHSFKNRNRLRERTDIHAQVTRRLRHVSRCAGIAWTSVGAQNIIIDRFGNSNEAEFIALIARKPAEAMGGSHRPIAANEQDLADRELLQQLQNTYLLLCRRLGARRAQSCTRRSRQA